MRKLRKFQQFNISWPTQHFAYLWAMVISGCHSPANRTKKPKVSSRSGFPYQYLMMNFNCILGLLFHTGWSKRREIWRTRARTQAGRNSYSAAIGNTSRFHVGQTTHSVGLLIVRWPSKV